MKSFGRFFSRYSMSCLVKDVPSFSSYRFVRASPGGVRNIPSGFVERIVFSVSSSVEGIVVSFFAGMKTFADLRSLRCFGGRYIAFPL